MKTLLVIFLFVLRLVIAIKVIFWLVQEYKYPEEHSFVDIEFYLVLLLLDIWISHSSNGVEPPPQE
jgi:hypothetical protein